MEAWRRCSTRLTCLASCCRCGRKILQTTPLREPYLQRAIGVVYRPDTERQSHYFTTRLADQFDAVLHFDETRAVEPLEHTPEWREGEPGEVPETYPFGV